MKKILVGRHCHSDKNTPCHSEVGRHYYADKDMTCHSVFSCHSEGEARRISSFAHVKKLCAFTLAEVMIALAVVGIIAALVLPVMMTNYNNRIYATKAR